MKAMLLWACMSVVLWLGLNVIFIPYTPLWAVLFLLACVAAGGRTLGP